MNLWFIMFELVLVHNLKKKKKKADEKKQLKDIPAVSIFVVIIFHCVHF